MALFLQGRQAGSLRHPKASPEATPPTVPEAGERSRVVTAAGPVDGPGIVRQDMVTG